MPSQSKEPDLMGGLAKIRTEPSSGLGAGIQLREVEDGNGGVGHADDATFTRA